MRRLGVIAASVLLLGGCSAADEPAARPPEPTDTIGVLPEDDAVRERARALRPGVVARFGIGFGTLCTGPQGRPSPPTDPDVRDQVSDLRRVDGLTVTRELTLHRDAAAAGAWVRRLRSEGPCVRVDGLRVTDSTLTPLAPDPRAPDGIPGGTLLRSQVLRTNGGTDPVLLVDLVSRRGSAVLVTQVMRLAAGPWAYDVPLPAAGSGRVVRRVDVEAREGVRLLDRVARPGRVER
ncbi:hypothetical protein [Nocardioides sp. CFH 31398]|uniref:hypothetical protein n=1 Tax=Nocardioides sp. CFH 31398 TaxID=2919579 RepID=UPI001F06CAF2|nr:hypothetical protein [Nocardioides sp. CFH 31398]MCH1867320.1 hypothetical protein [Nocardioides sp. CFH 31398]